ncbi:MAG: large-conductance mechanosensitive channel protein MscL [Candidatus Sumerlaeota bacterium]|nr:large-conductance mechanosensitive channel protein MscL [Candidatus Sumerlaeota bacterium]
MGILTEFKTFALKGNVVDMAVGIITGAAFGKVVSSLVADVVTPPLGLLLGGRDFGALTVKLKAATVDAPAVTLNYGKFVQAAVDFTIVAFAVFLLVKGINALRRGAEAAPTPEPAPTKQEALLAEIRDLLKRPR